MSKRRAKATRPQLVIILADNSTSMKQNGKAETATEGIRELIYACQKKSRSRSSYRLALCAFGTAVEWDPRCNATPCLEVDREIIEVKGGGGETKLAEALQLAYRLVRDTLEEILTNEAHERFPPPLLIIFSDGQLHSDKAAVLAAEQIKGLRLDEAHVLIATAGIIVDADPAAHDTLKAIATTPDCHMEVRELHKLKGFLAATGSSAAATPEELERVIADINTHG